MTRVVAPGLEWRETEGGMATCCRQCGRALAAAGQSWKAAAAVRERPLGAVAGEAFAGERPGVLLRHFACPGCGTLLDTETAVAGDPFLDDIVLS